MKGLGLVACVAASPRIAELENKTKEKGEKRMPSFLGSNLFVVCEETPAMASSRLRDELECWGAISELS